MISARKIFIKEIFEMYQARYILYLILLLPILLLLLIGDVGVQDSSIRVLVEPHEKAKPSVHMIKKYLSEFTQITVIEGEVNDGRLLQKIEDERLDLALIWTGDKWSVYSHHHRLHQFLSSLIHSLDQDIETSLWFSRFLMQAENNKSARKLPSFYVYFPSISGKNLSNVPTLIALLITFFPFLLASGTYIREIEACTLEVLLTAPRVNWGSIYWGKISVILFMTLMGLFLQLVFARTWFGFEMKSGFFLMLVQQMIAMLASTFLGLTILMFVKSQQNAYLTSAFYLVCLILLTGIIYPLEQVSEPVRMISWIFPLTFSKQPFIHWMSWGTSITIYKEESLWLMGQCIVYYGLFMASFYKAKHSI